MSWLLNSLRGDGDRGGGGGGRDRGRDRDYSPDRRRGGGRDDSRDRDRDRDRDRGGRRDDGRERFDDDDRGGGGGRRGRGRSDSSDSEERAEREREERRRQRAEREQRRQQDGEEERAMRDRMDPAAREREARRDRERERNRRDRFEDKDEEEDRRRRAERERERKQEEDAREALKAESEMIQVQEAVAADDPNELDQAYAGPVGTKKASYGFLGDFNLQFNHEAIHVAWAGAKIVTLVALFGYCIAMAMGNFPVQACGTSAQVPWCLRSGPLNATHQIRCWDRAETTGTCVDLCANELSAGDQANAGCFAMWPRGETPASPIAKAICRPKDVFETNCNDIRACDSKYISSLQKGYVPAVALFIIWAAWELLNALALMVWTGVHVDDFLNECNKSRVNRFLLIVCKLHPKVSQVLLIVTCICWIFLLMQYQSGASLCAHAQNELANPLTVFDNSRAFIAAYVLILFVLVLIGSLIRKFRPIRGELYVPSNDSELQPPCGIDLKDMRERPAPRMCPELWADCADPDSTVMCKPCATPCRVFWNTFFSVFLAPLGWLIESCFRHRHFIGT